MFGLLRSYIHELRALRLEIRMALADVASLANAVTAATGAITSLDNHIGNIVPADTQATIDAVAAATASLTSSVATIPPGNLT